MKKEKTGKERTNQVINFTGAAVVCGIIGDPVSQSLSPLLHRIFAAEEGRDFVYVPLPVKDRLQEAIVGAHALCIRGMNVTKPHKQNVMKYIRLKDSDAVLTGAVNTLVWSEKGYEGYNTDLPGLLDALRLSDIDIAGKDVIVLGAGGAARAVFVLAMRENAKSITVFNRTEQKAREAIAGIAEALNYSRYRVAELSLLKEEKREEMEKILPEKEYIAFQTTGIGMYPDVDACIVENPAFYEKISAGVDLIYTPARTRFLKNVEESAAEGTKICLNGLDMLLSQGVLSYKLWNPDARITPETRAKAKEALVEALYPKREEER